MKEYQIYIDGQWQDSSNKEFSDVINPATEEVIAKVSKGSQEDVDRAVNAAKKAFPKWNATPIEERVKYMERILSGIEANRPLLEETIVKELGSSKKFTEAVQVSLAISEIQATLDEIRTYSFQDQLDDAYVMKEGFGVVACITPWNYPLNQIQRKITPALLAGNTVVVKPASNTPITGLLLANIIDLAELPDGVFNLVTGSGSEAGDYLAGHPDVAVVSFTGSTDVGRGLYAQASQTIKKLVLELGGKSALIYLPGGNAKFAVKKAMDTVLNNQGQTCAALTRLLVPKDELETIKDELKAYYDATVVIGNPANEDTMVGPMVSDSQRQTVLDYIEKGKAEGAEILMGGGKIEGKGYYVEPTIFVNVTNDMTIAREEIFGPVLTVLTYETVEEAVEIANDSPYGLSGAVVGPVDEAEKVARQLRTGNVYINDGARNARAPFGGYKQSGIGRENGIYGVEDYLEIKTIFK